MIADVQYVHRSVVLETLSLQFAFPSGPVDGKPTDVGAIDSRNMIKSVQLSHPEKE